MTILDNLRPRATLLSRQHQTLVLLKLKSKSVAGPMKLLFVYQIHIRQVLNGNNM